VRKTAVSGAVLGAILAPAALLGVAGCTPADRPVVAVAYADGTPVARIVSCDDFVVNSIYVSDVTTEPATAEWNATSDGGTVPETITLLQAPSGWSVSTDTLTGFETGRKYSVNAYAKSKGVVPVHFTLDELKELKAGQVMIGKHQSKSAVVSEQEFQDAAKDSC
jgi:hypothetical protein